MSRRTVTHRTGGFSDAILLPVNTLSELRLIPSTDIVDKAIIFVEGVSGLFRFSYTASAGDNGSTVIAPAVGPGRWLLLNAAGGGGGSVGWDAVDRHVMNGLTSTMVLSFPDIVAADTGHMVVKNGLVMDLVEDYNIAGGNIVFVAAPGALAGDKVVVRYLRTGP